MEILNDRLINVVIDLDFSSSEDSLNDDLVAISIEDTDNKNESIVPNDEQKGEVLLPIRTAAMCEPNSYEWKEITQEFFEAVKGMSINF